MKSFKKLLAVGTVSMFALGSLFAFGASFSEDVKVKADSNQLKVNSSGEVVTPIPSGLGENTGVNKEELKYKYEKNNTYNNEIKNEYDVKCNFDKAPLDELFERLQKLADRVKLTEEDVEALVKLRAKSENCTLNNTIYLEKNGVLVETKNQCVVNYLEKKGFKVVKVEKENNEESYEKEKMFCTMEYKPVVCKVMVNGEEKVVKAGNECLLKQKLDEMGEYQIISCENNSENFMEKYKKEFENNKEVIALYKLSNEELKKILEEKAKELNLTEDDIQTIVNLNSNSSCVVRTIFSVEKNGVVFETSNKCLVDFLKEKGFKTQLGFKEMMEEKKSEMQRMRYKENGSFEFNGKGKIEFNESFKGKEMMKIELKQQMKLIHEIKQIAKMKNVSVQELNQLKNQIKEMKKEVEKQEKVVKEEIKQVKEELVKKLKEKKKLSKEDKEKAIQVIKQALETKLTAISTELSDLLIQLKELEDDKDMLALIGIDVDKTIQKVEDLINKVSQLQSDVENASSITELKTLVKEYIQIKLETVKIKSEISVKADTEGTNVSTSTEETATTQ